MQDIDFSTILWLATSASFDLYATVFFIGLFTRFDWIQGTPAYLLPLAKNGPLTLFGIIYFIEHIVEKIPGIAVAWNWFHVFARPITIILFLLITAFEFESGTLALSIIPVIVITLLINVFDAKLWTVIGLIPVVPIFITILEDIIVALIIIKKVAPHVTVH
jgi:hypothetical protein